MEEEKANDVQETDQKTDLKKERKEDQKRVIKIIIMWAVALLVIGLAVFHYNKGDDEEKEVFATISHFVKENPQIEFPTVYDVKEVKEWDSGVKQYEIISNNETYNMFVKKHKVIELWKDDDQKLYPVSNKTSLKNYHSIQKDSYSEFMKGKLGESLVIAYEFKHFLMEKKINDEDIGNLKSSNDQLKNLIKELSLVSVPDQWKKEHEKLQRSLIKIEKSQEKMIEKSEELWGFKKDSVNKNQIKSLQIANQSMNFIIDYLSKL